MMECGCCFGEEDVDKMVQCSDGHLFCSDCLQRYAQEAIHGQGKVINNIQGWLKLLWMN